MGEDEGELREGGRRGSRNVGGAEGPGGEARVSLALLPPFACGTSLAYSTCPFPLLALVHMGWPRTQQLTIC